MKRMIKMNQYCRYCSNCIYGDVFYCDEKEITMNEEEVKQNLIDRYVMLLQIKAAETGTNKVLDIQLAVTKVKLSSYNIDIESIEKLILE